MTHCPFCGNDAMTHIKKEHYCLCTLCGGSIELPTDLFDRLLSLDVTECCYSDFFPSVLFTQPNRKFEPITD
jgi:hypothetical protein